MSIGVDIDEMVIIYGGSFTDSLDGEFCGTDQNYCVVHMKWLHMGDVTSRGICEHFKF